jgi:tRNA modification GTPase
MEGSVSKQIRPVKDALIGVIAHLEAGIDFAEDDVTVPETVAILEQTRPILAQLEQLQETFGYGRMLTGGLHLALLGKPNVGKSSLFNRFVSNERAIVTDVPGTTRDVVTETISLDGVPLRIADTAGIRETDDKVESIGVSRTLETLSDAHLALVIIDGSAGLDDADRMVLEKAAAIPHFVIVNKADLPDALGPMRFDSTRFVRVSARTGAGLEEMRELIRRFVVGHKSELSDEFVLTNERQNEAVLRSTAALRTAMNALAERVPHEMVLLDYYEALSALDELTGEVVSDDILTRIFSTFCVGK